MDSFTNQNFAISGVCHTDELPYLFIYRIPDVHADQNDTKMKWAMPYMWANFAKTG